MEYERFKENITQRMCNRFCVLNNVDLMDGFRADLMAKRTSFFWQLFIFQSTYVFFKYLDCPNKSDFENIYNHAVDYIKKTNPFSFLKGFLYGYTIIPCIITSNLNEEIIQYVNECPPMHLALFELPVLYDLKSKDTHYFKGKTSWGCFILSKARKVISRYLEDELKVPDLLCRKGELKEEN